MDQGRKRLQRALKAILDRKQDKPDLKPALLGAYFNGRKTIKVEGRADFVHCRLRGATSEEIQAFNDSVGHHWDLPILVYRDSEAPGIWKVWGRDVSRYETWGVASYLPPHGRSHSFSGAEGADPVWISKRQFMPLLPHPNPTGTMSIYIEPDFYFVGGRYHWFPGTGTVDLTSYKPTGSITGKYVTIFIDADTLSLGYVGGDEFNLFNPPLDPSDFIPLPGATDVPLAAVYLLTGTNYIGWGEIYDLRYPGTPPPGTGTFSQTDIIFPEEEIGVMNWADGVPLGTGTIIDWGDNLDISLSGTVLRVDAQAGGGGDPPWIWIWEDGEPQGSGTIFNFADNLDVSVSGNVIEINASGGNGALITGSVGDWSVYYEFQTGSVLQDHHIKFDSATGSMITEISCSSLDADNVAATTRVQAMCVAGMRITIWAAADPLTWWMGRVTGCTAINGVRNLQVAYIDHSGGDTPFAEDERVVLTAAFIQPPTGSIDVYDDGIFQTEAWAIDFGDNLDVTVSGGVAFVDGQAGGGSGDLGVVAWDSGAFIGTGFILNFDDNLDVSVSGNVIEISASGGVAALATGIFNIEQVLYEVTLGSATGSIIIPDISQDYDHLRLVLVARTDNAAADRSIQMEFNGDTTAANYFWTRHIGSPASHSVGENDNRFFGVSLADNAPADNWSHIKADILDYADSTRNKVSTSRSSYREAAGDMRITHWTLDWENTAAINQINIETPNVELFLAGTYVQLIGIGQRALVTGYA